VVGADGQRPPTGAQRVVLWREQPHRWSPSPRPKPGGGLRLAPAQPRKRLLRSGVVGDWTGNGPRSVPL
jgi:hypothetical protein